MIKRGRKNKKGAISLSFGFIFSIIMIAAIIAVAFYAISFFLNLGRCADVSLFVRDLQENVDGAWSSEISKETFIVTVPRGIKSICFWDEAGENSGEEFREIKEFLRMDRNNMFFYPPENACDFPATKIDHIDVSELGWYCFPAEKNEVKIRLEKDSDNPLVVVKK